MDGYLDSINICICTQTEQYKLSPSLLLCASSCLCGCMHEYPCARQCFAAGFFLFFIFLREQQAWESLNFCH